ncbi:hypothetical protein RHGRI_032448 [Rhododendron griersonianum]|uniref:Uncharacterized protein n=1 Tax=Rhododendron griersonianum TaxID=479676 RepID=A0AAV6IE80_9ERIC|nr:hypothetical protein RHGRI_032448 [Rhododendron griersonianum]
MKLSLDGLLSPPSTSATCGSGEKPTDATIHACRPTKVLSVSVCLPDLRICGIWWFEP